MKQQLAEIAATPTALNLHVRQHDRGEERSGELPRAVKVFQHGPVEHQRRHPKAKAEPRQLAAHRRDLPEPEALRASRARPTGATLGPDAEARYRRALSPRLSAPERRPTRKATSRTSPRRSRADDPVRGPDPRRHQRFAVVVSTGRGSPASEETRPRPRRPRGKKLDGQWLLAPRMPDAQPLPHPSLATVRPPATRRRPRRGALTATTTIRGPRRFARAAAGAQGEPARSDPRPTY
jgi:hypothetical protein